jgi:hypothetical protein
VYAALVGVLYSITCNPIKSDGSEVVTERDCRFRVCIGGEMLADYGEVY